jgi:hypothetical protein
MSEIEGTNGLRFTHRAMMRVVKQKAEALAAGATLSDPGHQQRIVPFVDDHHICPVQRAFEVHRVKIIECASKRGIRASERIQRLVAVLLAKIAETPAVRGLEDIDPMASFLQLPDNAAKEVGVAVIPVGNQ